MEHLQIKRKSSTILLGEVFFYLTRPLMGDPVVLSKNRILITEHTYLKTFFEKYSHKTHQVKNKTTEHTISRYLRRHLNRQRHCMIRKKRSCVHHLYESAARKTDGKDPPKRKLEVFSM